LKFCSRFTSSRLNEQLAIVEFAKRGRFFFGIMKYVCHIVVKKFTFGDIML